VAAAFSLHPNVARHHLARLVDGGYLQVVLGPRHGAGRPSQRYSPVDLDPVVDLLVGETTCSSSCWRRALELLGPMEAERMGAEVGEEYGRALAARMSPDEGQRSVRSAMHAIAATLTGTGFAAHAEDLGAATAVVAEQCPFGDGATTPPVLCAVDRGMVHGLLAGLCGETTERACRSCCRRARAATTPAPRWPDPPVPRHYLDHASTSPLRPEVLATFATGWTSRPPIPVASTRRAGPCGCTSRPPARRWPRSSPRDPAR